MLKGGGLGAGWSGDEGQDDGGAQASHRGALAPSPPGPPSAPCWLHHDSRWCWAGRARCLHTHRDRRIDKTTDDASTYTQPALACLAAISHTGPWPQGASCRPARSVQEEGDREGREGAQEVDDGHREQKRGPAWLIVFLVLCWLWRGFLGLAGSAGPRSGLWDCGSILFGDSCAGRRCESPCCSGRLGPGCQC